MKCGFFASSNLNKPKDCNVCIYKEPVGCKMQGTNNKTALVHDHPPSYDRMLNYGRRW